MTPEGTFCRGAALPVAPSHSAQTRRRHLISSGLSAGKPAYLFTASLLIWQLFNFLPLVDMLEIFTSLMILNMCREIQHSHFWREVQKQALHSYLWREVQKQALLSSLWREVQKQAVDSLP